MKRRTFLTATSTVGIVGVASSATIASSIYSNISTNQLLEEFNAPTRSALNKFVSNIAENAESVGLDASFAKKMAMPVQILSKDSHKDNHNIVYTTKNGQTVTLKIQNGVERIVIK